MISVDASRLSGTDTEGLADAAEAPMPARAPSYTQLLQRKIANRVAQRKADGGAAREASMPAPSGGGAALPEAVQRKMGDSLGADFSTVRVHQGEHVSALGAEAYAQGENVHFAPGRFDPHGASGQALIGHELTHVVQQRAGRVAEPQGKGLPINGDASLEAEADDLGQRAARGEVATVPGAPSGGHAGGGVVQGYFKLNNEEMKQVVAKDTSFIGQETGSDLNNPKSFTDGNGKVNVKEATDKIPPLRVSDDGNMAIEDSDLTSRQPKVFFLTESLISSSNNELKKVKSDYRLAPDGSKLDVTDREGNAHKLKGVVGRSEVDKTEGKDLTGPVRCNEMAGKVTGQADSLMKLKTNTKETPKINQRDFGAQMASYILAYSNKTDELKDDNVGKNWFTKTSDKSIKKQSEKSGQEGASGVKYKAIVPKVKVPVVEVLVEEGKVDKFLSDLGRESVFKASTEKGKVSDGKMPIKVICRGGPDIKKLLTEKNDLKSVIESSKDLEDAEVDGKVTSDMSDVQNDIASKYGKLDEKKLDETSKEIGVNDYAAPDVGDAFMVAPVGSPDENNEIHDVRKDKNVKAEFPYHWGGVVARSGGDVVTLENYARNEEDGQKKDPSTENRQFFQMYGAKGSPNKESKTFHEFWSQYFGNAITVAYKNTGKK